jgi:enoyl-CoA hydratase/carnithine racemase
MLLTGRPIGSGRAYELGLLSEVVDDGAAEEAALELAGRIAANAPVAVQSTLRTVRQVVSTTDEQNWALSDATNLHVLASNDRTEGIRAFLEKRPPKWSGT